jgi:hypothetical protein
VTRIFDGVLFFTRLKYAYLNLFYMGVNLFCLKKGKYSRQINSRTYTIQFVPDTSRWGNFKLYLCAGNRVMEKNLLDLDFRMVQVKY